MRNSIKNIEEGKIGQLHNNSWTKTHDQSKISNLIPNRHRHINKAGTKIMIHPHNVVHAS